MVFDFNQEAASAGDDGVGIDMAVQGQSGESYFPARAGNAAPRHRKMGK